MKYRESSTDWYTSYREATYFYKTCSGSKDAAALLKWASRNGYEKLVEQLLSNRPSYVQLAFLETLPDMTYNCALEYLKAGADIRSTNSQHQNGLFLASFGGNAQIVELFLKKGIDVNSTDDTTTTSLQIGKSDSLS